MHNAAVSCSRVQKYARGDLKCRVSKETYRFNSGPGTKESTREPLHRLPGIAQSSAAPPLLSTNHRPPGRHRLLKFLQFGDTFLT
jgi:hypothetical protein